MAIGYLDDSKLTAIANSIRTKTGSSSTMTVDDMPTEIAAIAPATPTQTKSVTIASNTVTTITPDTGYDLSEVTVTTAVPGGASDIQAIGQQYLDMAEGQGTTIDLSSQTYTGTFYGLSGCTSFTLPTGVSGLAPYSLSFKPDMFGCSVTIPASVRKMSDYVFGVYQSTAEANDLYWFDISFAPRTSADTLLVYAFAFGRTKINSLVFPAPTTFRYDFNTSTPNSIFSYSRIKAIDISACTNLTQLGDYFFERNEVMNSVALPESLTSIGSSVFYNCIGLTTLTIPAAVTSLGTFAFYGLSGCTIHFKATVPATKQANTFGNTWSTSSWPKVYVPYSADHSVLAAYQSAWSDVDAGGKLFEEPAP